MPLCRTIKIALLLGCKCKGKLTTTSNLDYSTWKLVLTWLLTLDLVANKLWKAVWPGHVRRYLVSCASPYPPCYGYNSRNTESRGWRTRLVGTHKQMPNNCRYLVIGAEKPSGYGGYPLYRSLYIVMHIPHDGHNGFQSKSCLRNPGAILERMKSGDKVSETGSTA